jgi:hypothetical protein
MSRELSGKRCGGIAPYLGRYLSDESVAQQKENWLEFNRLASGCGET